MKRFAGLKLKGSNRDIKPLSLISDMVSGFRGGYFLRSPTPFYVNHLYNNN